VNIPDDVTQEQWARFSEHVKHVEGPESDPAQFWDAMEERHRREWIWHDEHPHDSFGAYDAEHERLAAEADFETAAAFDLVVQRPAHGTAAGARTESASVSTDDYDRAAADAEERWHEQTVLAKAAQLFAPSDDPLPNEPWTELGYARRLVDVYGESLRFVPAWGRWLVWDGMRWANDTSGQVARWQKLIARRQTNYALTIDDDKRRNTLLRAAHRGESSPGVSGALKLASTEPGVAISPDDLDADPLLLNCRNGVLDLRTGELIPHNPALLLTKLAGADYRADASDVEFTKFLTRIQPDQAMRDYLARLFGHALEGRVIEHVLPILHGVGANGKGTLIAALLAALGDYADAADPELLTARSFDAHPTGVADLFGLRVAVLHETDHGRRLAEGTVKRLTGGDKLKARRMREDFWSFSPSHTFVLLTNHKPLVTGQDEGIWRRLRLIPFEVVIPPEHRDEHLSERLALEADAVLTWLVGGYRAWQSGGFDEPTAVVDATANYRAESDHVGTFLEERCLVGPNWRVRSSELYSAWTRWCDRAEVDAGSNKAFTQALELHGFERDPHKRAGTFWRGIGLAAEPVTGDGS
jgi:putative DNA primase/helicase